MKVTVELEVPDAFVSDQEVLENFAPAHTAMKVLIEQELSIRISVLSVEIDNGDKKVKVDFPTSA